MKYAFILLLLLGVLTLLEAGKPHGKNKDRRVPYFDGELPRKPTRIANRGRNQRSNRPLSSRKEDPIRIANIERPDDSQEQHSVSAREHHRDRNQGSNYREPSHHGVYELNLDDSQELRPSRNSYDGGGGHGTTHNPSEPSTLPVPFNHSLDDSLERLRSVLESSARELECSARKLACIFSRPGMRSRNFCAKMNASMTCTFNLLKDCPMQRCPQEIRDEAVDAYKLVCERQVDAIERNLECIFKDSVVQEFSRLCCSRAFTESATGATSPESEES